MLIETPRLVMRPWTLDDIPVLRPILTDPTTMAFWEKPFTPEQVVAWVEWAIRHFEDHGYSRFALLLKAEGIVIGDAGIVDTTLDGRDIHDLGYIIHHHYWGHGYATEAAEAWKRHAFDVLGLPAIHANMAHDHHASRRVAEKIGMRRVHEFHHPRNRGILTYLYELRREDDDAGSR